MHKQNKSKLTPTNVLNFLLQEERRSGTILVLVTVIALFLANSAWSNLYTDFIHKQFSLGAITLDTRHWISEGLMALFFLVVTLEVKREFVDGELRTWKKASFPIFAAIGGMVVPAIIYLLINQNLPESAGWAVPIATDIAIAISVLALLGKRIPRNLRVFLLALAIIDDLGSIAVIALFYSHPDNTLAVIGALVLAFALVVLRSRKYWIPSFITIGLLMWYCLLLAGVSGTIAGVIIAALMPLTSSRSKNKIQSSEKIEDLLLPITAYFVVPLFVFANVGLSFSSVSFAESGSISVFAGVLAGLLVGKPLGIVGASLVATMLGLTKKPAGLSWIHITGVGFIAGIGFTISLLISDLSFNGNDNLHNASIIGVFVASIISGLIGLTILSSSGQQKR